LSLLISRVQDQSHGARERSPFRLFTGELFPPEMRELVIPGALAFVGQLPRGCYPSLRFKPMETGIQRTGLDLEHLFRGPLNVFGDSVAVRGSRKQRAEDEEVERALQQLYTDGGSRCIV
jgi:hypothetical protein